MNWFLLTILTIFGWVFWEWWSLRYPDKANQKWFTFLILGVAIVGMLGFRTFMDWTQIESNERCVTRIEADHDAAFRAQGSLTRELRVYSYRIVPCSDPDSSGIRYSPTVGNQMDEEVRQLNAEFVATYESSLDD